MIKQNPIISTKQFLRLGIVMVCICILAFWISSKSQTGIRLSDYSISKKESDRFTAVKYDATDTHLYFLNEKGYTTVIRILDSQGAYLRTIEFSDVSNGASYLRVFDNQLFLRLRNGNVFVLGGEDGGIQHGMTRTDADSKGYTYQWFTDAESALSLDSESIYRSDGSGAIVSQIAKPGFIHVSDVPQPFSPFAKIFFTIVVFGLFFAAWGWVTIGSVLKK